MTENHVSWLVTVPTGDINFKTHLKEASVDDLREALAQVEGQPKTATKVKALCAELKRREKTEGETDGTGH